MDKVFRFTDEGCEKWAFFCPACGHHHWFRTKGPREPCWEFNGNVENPTVTPSILCDMGVHNRCHLFITDGKLIYCGDCTHRLAGVTIDMHAVGIQKQHIYNLHYSEEE